MTPTPHPSPTERELRAKLAAARAAIRLFHETFHDRMGHTGACAVCDKPSCEGAQRILELTAP